MFRQVVILLTWRPGRTPSTRSRPPSASSSSSLRSAPWRTWTPASTPLASRTPHPSCRVVWNPASRLGLSSPGPPRPDWDPNGIRMHGDPTTRRRRRSLRSLWLSGPLERERPPSSAPDGVPRRPRDESRLDLSASYHEDGAQSHVWGGVTAGLLVHDDLARRCSCVKENKGHTPRQDERERRPAGCHHLWRAIGRGVALQHERCAGCGGLCGDRGLEGNRGRED